MVAIGIDNGVTGSVGIITDVSNVFYRTPNKKELNYTKAKQHITRINVVALSNILATYTDTQERVVVAIERPMVNPKRFKATLSAIRALEATIGILEHHSLGYQYIDSKEWQRELLPKGISGSVELKSASMDIGIRLYPLWEKTIRSHKDADGLLIAHYLFNKKINK